MEVHPSFLQEGQKKEPYMVTVITTWFLCVLP